MNKLHQNNNNHRGGQIFNQNFNNYVVIVYGKIDIIHTIVICISNDLTHHNIRMLSLPLCNKEPIP